MSRHKNSKSRRIRDMIYLGTFLVASVRDLRERRKMKHLGYVIDMREGVAPPTPTRGELISNLEEQGYRGVLLTSPKRRYSSSNRLNPHQYVSAYCLLRAEQFENSGLVAAAGGA